MCFTGFPGAALRTKAPEEDIDAVDLETLRRWKGDILRKLHIEDTAATTAPQMAVTRLLGEVIPAVAALKFQFFQQSALGKDVQ